MDPPAPLKVTPKYVFADPEAKAYPQSFNPTPMVCQAPPPLPEKDILPGQKEIKLAHTMHRGEFRKLIASKVDHVLQKYGAQAIENITFEEQMDALPGRLAQGIACLQYTNRYWRLEMRMHARANLPNEIRPRKGFERRPRVMSDITDSLTSSEGLVDEDIGSSTHTRSNSESSAGTGSSASTLVDDPEIGSQEMIDAGEGSPSFVQARKISLVGGVKYDPRTRTVTRASVKLERTESMHSFDSKTSIRKRIRSLVGSSKK